ncbi:MAG: DUF1848 family protein [Promethearchaeota archaeon]
MKPVISCSRRTDIPAFFLDWLLEGLNNGELNVQHPITKQWRIVPLDPKEIHTLVLWSKDFHKVLQRWGDLASLLTDKSGNIRLFFQFTINSFLPLLEPGLTKSLDIRLTQVEEISELTSPRHINWRFDPIVFWREDTEQKDNLRDFNFLVESLAAIGIKRCYFSFATWYGKCKQRARKRGFQYIEPSIKEKIAITNQLIKKTDTYNISLSNCCNPEVNQIPGIQQAGCIDGALLSRLMGERASHARDFGQRENCQCTRSIDIGNYTQLCDHSCVYCYANPRI